MPTYRPANESTIIGRFSSPEGMPLVLDQPDGPGRALLSVAKVAGGCSKGPVLDTAADIVYDERTGRVRDHKPINPSGFWTEHQITAWVREAEADLIRHLGVHDSPPCLADVEQWWRELIDGTLTRQQVHELVARWVEFASGEIDGPQARSGLAHLHSFAMRYANQDKGITTYGGTGPLVHSDTEVAETYKQWHALHAPPTTSTSPNTSTN
ncbi:hypothetical protein [Glycomyces xiaoerkulensis]|uniref:hypothetical protein n=1 Tax=Glycomyces xiaoerkulensis TaxID=2038139 RepID=UPI000C25A2A1|nr:hypothetical protein [Glycomyces xiaoerkulensis]